MKFKLNNVLFLVLINSVFWLSGLNIKHITILQIINLALLFIILVLICINKIISKRYMKLKS